MQDGLPPVPPDAVEALMHAYPPAHRACFPAPERTPGHDLGAMAVASPYASYLQATGDGAYRWDLHVLTGFECHPGLVELGAVVDFRLDAATSALEPVHIETALGVEKPDSAGWEAAVRMAMCSITSHASMVRHFNWLHLTGGPVFEAVTRNHLPADHPVRRLVWAHVFGTHGGNDLVTEILMSEGGEFDAIFSLTHRGKCQLFEATAGDFDLAAINPLTDVVRRGLAGSGVPTSRSRELERPVRRVPRPRPSVPRAVLRVRRRRRERPGARCVDRRPRRPAAARGAGRPGTGHDARRGGVARWRRSCTWPRSSTRSPAAGCGTTSCGATPRRCACTRTAAACPVDVYQRLVNANFNLNVPRTMLLDDAMPGLAVDPAGAWAFQELQQDLLGFQAKLDTTAPAPWRMEPRRLKANINA